MKLFAIRLHFGIRFRMGELGNLELADIDLPTHDALYKGYPILDATAAEMATRWPSIGQIEEHRAEHNALMEDALIRERTRLMLPSAKDKKISS